jgi:lipoprotein-releasing system ATP-binding protein
LQAVGLLEGGFQGSIRIAGEEAAQLDNEGRTRLRRPRSGFVYQFTTCCPTFNAAEKCRVAPAYLRRHAGGRRRRAPAVCSARLASAIA